MIGVRRLLAALVAAALVAAIAASPAGAAPSTREVLYVGNNWDGTADVVDPHTFTRIARLVGDHPQRMRMGRFPGTAA